MYVCIYMYIYVCMADKGSSVVVWDRSDCLKTTARSELIRKC